MHHVRLATVGLSQLLAQKVMFRLSVAGQFGFLWLSALAGYSGMTVPPTFSIQKANKPMPTFREKMFENLP